MVDNSGRHGDYSGIILSECKAVKSKLPEARTTNGKMCFTLCYFIKFSQDKLYFLIEILNDLVRLEEQKSSYDKFLIQGQNNQEHYKLQDIKAHAY